MEKARTIAAVALAALGMAHTAYAGNIPGQLVDSRNVPRPHIYTSCNIAGSGSGTGTTATGSDGIFYWSGLPAGTYSQGFSEKEHYEALYRKNIQVPASGDAQWTVLSYKPNTYARGTHWFTTWRTWYAQSFRATGENVVSVGLRTAGSDGLNIAVQILDGDNPYAPQIGPTRTLGYSSTNGQCAYWSAGEVPTVPGRVYTVRLSVEGGGQFSPWRQTIREWNRAENPDGRVWADGVEVETPMELTVNMDDAGISNTMCCARHFTGTWIANDCGQTFTARGSSVLMVTWMTGVDKLWEVSVHDGVGGAQIGPSKFVYGVAWNGRAVVTFAPGEVPTTPGNVYYVKLRPTVPPDPGQNHVVYHVNSDFYSGGQGYRDGAIQYYDWAMAIYEEKYSGALDQAGVNISNFRVESITPTTAVVKWSTLLPADSTVDYGETTPYPHTVYDSSSVFNHSVTLTGLKPNTIYHVRAISRASGVRQSKTRDSVFLTLPDRPNLLADPGFESGAFGAWTSFGGSDFVGPGWFWGSGPRTGARCVGHATNGGAIQSGVRQRVMAVPGEKYQLTAWVYTYNADISAMEGYQTVARIGIDPTGGIDRTSPNVIWCPATHAQQLYTPLSVSATAAGSYITVFLYGGNDTSTLWSVYTYDDVTLTGPSPTAVTLGQALADLPDGTFVGVSGVKCIATSAQIGAYYVEATDRSCGIRVNTGDSMNVGDLVNVIGFVSTRTTGEKQLASAVVSSKTPSTALAPIYARAVAIGGASPGSHCLGIPDTLGAYNVGMLMRVSGEVKAVESGTIYVNDGSLPGSGLRVSTASLGTIPGVGQFVRVTGVVRLQGTAGEAIPVLRPRSSADVQIGGI